MNLSTEIQASTNPPALHQSFPQFAFSVRCFESCPASTRMDAPAAITIGAAGATTLNETIWHVLEECQYMPPRQSFAAELSKSSQRHEMRHIKGEGDGD